MVPPGFHVEVYADHLKDAREMVLSPSGTLFVSTRSSGNVYAVVDRAHQSRADKAYLIASGLENPNGVALRDGALYVAERSRILRFDDIEKHLDAPPKPVVIRADFPDKAHHGWKFIAFGPDGWLYVPVGSPCNVCKSTDPIYASITRISPDGKRRDRRAWRAQHRRLRLASDLTRPVVHRQRPRWDGRRHSAGGVEPRAQARPRLWLPLLSR